MNYGGKEKGTYVPPHRHECFEVVYYASGNGRTAIGSTSYAFRPGTFALLAPNIVHDEQHFAVGELVFIGFHCDAAGLEERSAVYEDDAAGNVQQLLQRIKDEFMHQREGFADMLNLLVGQLAIHLRRIAGGQGPKHDPAANRLLYVRNYMDEHFRQKIAIESLAELSGYSYDRFRHLFKEAAGLAPLQYLFRKRLEYAKKLLLHTDASISEVASEAGYVNDAQFCSMFKRETGETPRAYRVERCGTAEYAAAERTD